MWFPWQKGPSGFSARSTAEDVTQGIDASGLTAIVTAFVDVVRSRSHDAREEREVGKAWDIERSGSRHVTKAVILKAEDPVPQIVCRGASSGIGTETARVLALRGAHVIIAVRNVDSGTKVKENILKQIPNAKIDVMELDLTSLASVRKFASNFDSLGLPLNLLVNNAGIMATPFALSQDGIEMQFATNHIGHFLLTNLLLDNMKNTARDSNKEGRIVNVSSEGHKFAYKGIDFDQISDPSSYSSLYAYGVSKLANILHAKELSKRLKEEDANITVNSLHPGSIVTNLVRHRTFIFGLVQSIGKLFLKNVEQGAATQCYLALNPKVEGVSGEYFCDSNIAKPNAFGCDAELAKKLWDFSLTLTDPK